MVQYKWPETCSFIRPFVKDAEHYPVSLPPSINWYFLSFVISRLWVDFCPHIPEIRWRYKPGLLIVWIL